MNEKSPLSQKVFVYGLVGACLAVMVLDDGLRWFTLAYALVVWMLFGMHFVFVRRKESLPGHLHQMLYAGLWWPWYLLRRLKEGEPR